MKKILALGVFAAFAIAPASAEDLESHCVAVTAESGGDSSGCACLAAAADADMTAELLAVASDADVEMLSDASKEAIASCWPEA